jgi:hypothetical protein
MSCVSGRRAPLVALCPVLFTLACGGREDLLVPLDAGSDGGSIAHTDAGRSPDGAARDAGHPGDSGVGPRPDGGSFDAGEQDSSESDAGEQDGEGACPSGFHDCGGSCLDDTSAASCGTSCTPCAAPSNGVAACATGACSYTCEVGYSICSTGCCTCGDTQTDPHNCGFCGHDCGTGDCVAGVCASVVVATAQANAYAVVADDTYVYWTTNGASGAILRAPVGGGGAEVLASGSTDYPAGIAVDANNVYWSNEVAGGAIQSIPIGGGTPKTIAANLDTPLALAVVGSTLYFTLDPFEGTTAGAVMQVPVTGGAPTTIASSQNQPSSIAVGGGQVFWADQVDLMASSLAPANARSFAPSEYPYAVAADATNVYWTTGLNGGAVVQEPLGGGTSITLASGQYYPNAVAVDAANVYWTTGQGGAGTVMKVPIGGGAPVALATGQAYPSGIALNSTSVFWVDFGDGTIRAVPK